jgi:hypothetical protein
MTAAGAGAVTGNAANPWVYAVVSPAGGALGACATSAFGLQTGR